MHFQPAHIRARDAVVARRPQLLNLPVPIPSIPILAPIVTLLVGGSNPTPNLPTQPTTTTSSILKPTTVNPGNGGGNGGGNSGGGNTDGGNTGGGSSVGGGASASNTPATTSRIPSVSDKTSSTTTLNGTGTLDESSKTALPTNINGGISGPVGSAGDIPTISGSSDSSVNQPGGGGGGAGLPNSSNGSGTSGGGGTHGGGIPGSVGGGSDNRGLSKGVIAAIVIITLIALLAAVVLLLRFRAKSRHHRQAHRWWFYRKRTSGSYGDLQRSQSSCSSFATNFDRSNSPLPGTDIPPLPSMTDISHFTISVDQPYAGIRDDRSSNDISWYTREDITPTDSRTASLTSTSHEELALEKHPSLPRTPLKLSSSTLPPPLPPGRVVIPNSYFRLSNVAIPPLPPLPSSPPPVPYTNPFMDIDPFEDSHHDVS